MIQTDIHRLWLDRPAGLAGSLDREKALRSSAVPLPAAAVIDLCHKLGGHDRRSVFQMFSALSEVGWRNRFGVLPLTLLCYGTDVDT